MFDELNNAIDSYQAKWEALCTGRKDAAFFRALRPTAIGWKVADRAEYDKLFALWHDACDQITEVWLNGRYIAKMHLREELHSGITIVKLMERRPNSTDAVGLDHLDFYAADPVTTPAMQAKEPDLKFSEEANGVCRWTSLWFDGTEAKLRNDTVLSVIVIELQDLEKQILQTPPGLSKST